MNSWRIIKCGDDPVIDFATNELKRYIRTMDRSAIVEVVFWKKGYELSGKGILVGMNEELAAYVPTVENVELDDAIAIEVKNGNGYITASNPRSVLIAVYRYLREVGCSFVRPGLDGDVIPHKNALEDCVSVKEAASYRHRCVCIEGAPSSEHIIDLIDWLPKNAMNGYFTQFGTPTEFIRRWYEHDLNPTMEAEPITDDEIEGLTSAIEAEVFRRGLMYHAIGHGWTSIDAFHVNNSKDWIRDVTKPCPEYAQYIAMINGKRDVLPRYSPCDTNLCYSMPYVRNAMTDAVVDYCKIHPNTAYLHFWLADGLNNHCECEDCQKMVPADWYVTMLNELDDKLTAEGLDTRIVFLIYVDLLWEPQQVRIKNPERFTLMFAPITRDYSNSFKLDKSIDLDHYPLTEYVRNKLPMPYAVEENVARLRRWQKMFGGDSFDFDYHLMWAHYSDPSYMHIARIMYEDMVGLEDIGLNGMNSCQEQRIFFPSGIVMEVMARTLWNKTESFEGICADYFDRCYGKDGNKVHEFFDTLGRLFDAPALRGQAVIRSDGYDGASNPDGSVNREAQLASLRKIKPVIQQFTATLEENMEQENDAIAQSWFYLKQYLPYADMLADAFIAKFDGDDKLAHELYLKFKDYICEIEPEIHRVFEVYEAVCSLRKFFPEVNN